MAQRWYQKASVQVAVVTVAGGIIVTLINSGAPTFYAGTRELTTQARPRTAGRGYSGS